ncbi:GIY-YIG nuclease family protein [Listeria floridensis]
MWEKILDNRVRTLYVLKQENNSYYIGQTIQLDNRLKKHFLKEKVLIGHN